MTAIQFSHPEVVKMMIENRKHEEQETIDGRTALKVVNDRIELAEEGRGEDIATFKELKDILEEAISADNVPQPKKTKMTFVKGE